MQDRYDESIPGYYSMKRQKRKYDNTARKERAMNRALKRAVEAEAKREHSVTGKREGRPRNERNREARLKALPADRRCPKCLNVVLNSRSWIVMKSTGHELGAGIVQCKKCFAKVIKLQRGDV